MRIRFIAYLIILSLLFSSCSTGTPQATPEVVSVYSTSAAEPWLSDLYTCAGNSAILLRVDDPSAADISLRVGEPEFLLDPAYQVGTEEILVVTYRQSPVQNLTLEQVQALFSQGVPSVQVWVYASDEDIQQVFDRSVMEGRGVASFALIAASPQQMSDILVSQPNTVGILPRHWKAGDVRDVYSVATVPVLALTKSEPQGVINQLIGCLQK